jgi:hypothetical protein
MKVSTSLLVVFSSALSLHSTAAFTVGGNCLNHQHHRQASAALTRPYMFGGAGAGVPNEDNPEEMKQMEDAAKQMGMSLDEYKLGIGARSRLMTELDGARVFSGNKDTVAVERDGNNPPKLLEITITEAGKALGKDAVSAELVKTLQEASESSRATRTTAQKNMMEYIGEEMKKIGN